MGLARCTFLGSAVGIALASKIVARNGGVFIDGAPFAPAGYCNHGKLAATGHRSYDAEVVEGFTSLFVYRGLPGQGEGRWANQSWDDTMAFLDRAAAIGLRVLFDFSQNAMLPDADPVHRGPDAPPPQYELIADAVRRVKDHPALLSWYLIDEPDGSRYPPQYVAKAASLIRSLDPNHPISMCFDTTSRPRGTWPEYVNSTDIVVADIYPVINRQNACALDLGCDINAIVGDSLSITIQDTNKTLWFIPQIFGSQESYQREPSRGEVRIMAYVALIHGATGVFFFTKEDVDRAPPVSKGYVHVGTAQPRSSNLWNECRRLALEIGELGPSLMTGASRLNIFSDMTGIVVGAFAESIHSVLVLAVNTLSYPVPAVTFTVALPAAAGEAWFAEELFASSFRLVPVKKSPGTFFANITDSMDAMSTRVYRLELNTSLGFAGVLPSVPTDPLASNLVFNGDLEFCTNVGTPDGFWAAWGGDASATAFADTAVVRSGRHSLRLITPVEGQGLRIWTFPIKANMLIGENYTLGFWARGGDPDLVLTIGMEAMFGEANTTCPNGEKGQCSYTPQPFMLEMNTWKYFTVSAPCRFQPDHTGYHGAAGMISVELVSRGRAWIDLLTLALTNTSTGIVDSGNDPKLIEAAYI